MSETQAIAEAGEAVIPAFPLDVELVDGNGRAQIAFDPRAVTAATATLRLINPSASDALVLDRDLTLSFARGTFSTPESIAVTAATQGSWTRRADGAGAAAGAGAASTGDGRAVRVALRAGDRQTIAAGASLSLTLGGLAPNVAAGTLRARLVLGYGVRLGSTVVPAERETTVLLLESAAIASAVGGVAPSASAGSGSTVPASAWPGSPPPLVAALRFSDVVVCTAADQGDRTTCLPFICSNRSDVTLSGVGGALDRDPKARIEISIAVEPENGNTPGALCRHGDLDRISVKTFGHLDVGNVPRRYAEGRATWTLEMSRQRPKMYPNWRIFFNLDGIVSKLAPGPTPVDFRFVNFGTGDFSQRLWVRKSWTVPPGHMSDTKAVPSSSTLAAEPMSIAGALATNATRLGIASADDAVELSAEKPRRNAGADPTALRLKAPGGVEIQARGHPAYDDALSVNGRLNVSGYADLKWVSANSVQANDVGVGGALSIGGLCNIRCLIIGSVNADGNKRSGSGFSCKAVSGSYGLYAITPQQGPGGGEWYAFAASADFAVNVGHIGFAFSTDTKANGGSILVQLKDSNSRDECAAAFNFLLIRA